MFYSFLLFLFIATLPLTAAVRVGVERLFSPPYQAWIEGKRIGLIANRTAIDSCGITTLERLKSERSRCRFEITALFAPEHGFHGELAAGEKVPEGATDDNIPIHSLHGATWRPTEKMLANIDLLIYDIQDIGSRSYTYAATLYFAMEEAAKRSIPVIVLDRPNPINGLTVDGPVLRSEWRSPVGYLAIPYCHGLTIGELARYFNGEYKIGCDLHIVPMEGWHRAMTFADTGLLWMPTSPNIPEPTTPLYYPMTGILGELSIANIGIGGTLPFKIAVAPWINAVRLASHLNAQKFPGVLFLPFHFRPQQGLYAGEACQGVLLRVTDPAAFLPVSSQYLILGALKSLYPTQFHHHLERSKDRIPMFNRINGTDEVTALLQSTGPVIWPLRALHERERTAFQKRRLSYLFAEYSENWHSSLSSAKK